MIWLVTRLVVWPLRAAFVSARLAYGAGRLVGLSRVVLLVVGVALGLLVAPGPGRELRERIRRRLEGGADPPSTSSWPPAAAPRPPSSGTSPLGAVESAPPVATVAAPPVDDLPDEPGTSNPT